jgi:diguanylate cyclase (GGDEF)-like protein
LSLAETGGGFVAGYTSPDPHDRLPRRPFPAAAALDRHGAADELQNAYRDDLTGTLVRAAGRDQLMQAVARAHRTGETLVVAFVDVDHLKQVNDEHGHLARDNLLRAVGTALREGLRSYDVVVRYGGDEFVCGLPDVGLTEAERRFIDVANLFNN